MVYDRGPKIELDTPSPIANGRPDQPACAGQPCIINGDGLATRDYVYVSDAADAFGGATDRGHGLLNIASAHERSVLDIHEVVKERG